ncbi:Putative multidrug export ATP-binding/permease protein [Jeotgalicoccus aerolatus]|uniref:ATP-binding cassette subfamily B protein AbcA/BmrA n=2 Tax=Jeotgalicoccus aerolatus TaxID=709510 RepID=A0ABS4HQD0_9STAP|nr:ABC transporter ATP-binding protein [Jeotgalicoccus aerolatus]MBP1952814.1 ATP-binding cassette subfamily B protein AbcA/BmrA [Jeotgalicoccus aerolatus]GGE07861.1 ABC transporter ATP-binding protein [Jeotgalicoccus aerolatus]CAD2080648.1 Putative multidrug export ATP-binding/permease protein [Jeotgalicoccus aerolatus]
MEKTEEKASFKKFIMLIKSTNVKKGLFFTGVFLTLIGTAGSLIVPLLTQMFIDGFNTDLITAPLAALIIGVFLISAIIDGISYYMLAKIGQTVVKSLREMVWDKFLRLPVSYFDKTKSGESVSRVVNDTSIIQNLITSHFPQLISGILSVAGSIVILFFLDWKLTLIMFIALPISIVAIMPLGSRMQKVSKKLQDETASFTGSIQETLSEIRLMKSFNAESYEKIKGNKGINELFKYGMKEAVINALLSPIMYTIMMFVIILVIGYGGLRGAAGTMSIGTLVAFLLYLFQIIMPMTMFAMFFTEYNKALGATGRIIGILEMENEKSAADTEELLTYETLSFNNVTFGYDKTPVLENISFTAENNKKIAFVGPSGSGKSTIFSLIERYYSVWDGEITIDNTNIENIPLDLYRSGIGYVAQESAIISGTIKENITYGLTAGEYTDEDIKRAVQQSYTSEFINDLPEGLETEVGERGVKLSGGQRQRLGIARAFLRNPKILMLDEATASLDSQSEKFVGEALNELMAGRTVLVIAHRLSTIVNSDKIYFIDSGHLTGEGTHEELMASHDMYKAFTAQQFGED